MEKQIGEKGWEAVQRWQKARVIKMWPKEINKTSQTQYLRRRRTNPLVIIENCNCLSLLKNYLITQSKDQI